MKALIAIAFCLSVGIESTFGQYYDQDRFGSLVDNRWRFPEIQNAEDERDDQRGGGFGHMEAEQHSNHYMVPDSTPPDFGWYKPSLMQKYLPPSYKGQSHHQNKHYYKGQTFFIKAKPLYIQRKPIVKIVQQPIYVTQPIIIKKQQVIHKKEVVSVEKSDPVEADVTLPEVNIKPVRKPESLGSDKTMPMVEKIDISEMMRLDKAMAKAKDKSNPDPRVVPDGMSGQM